MKKKQKRVFLDHASTTPVLPEVFRAMHQYFSTKYANPSALYEEGVMMKKVVEDSRKKIADIISSHSDEIIFTGSGTEADNLAIFGILDGLKLKIKKPHIIVSLIEHPAILEAVKVFIANGGEVSYLPMYPDGCVQAKDLKKILRPETILVSIMHANNEIGTVQPIKEIAKTIRHFRKNKKKENFLPYFHTDASQAANYLPLGIPQLGVDMMTLDASKIYGPKGIGMLFVRRGIEIVAQIVGGGQESGRRSGTESVASIVGFAKALSIVQGDFEKEGKRLVKIRDEAIGLIKKQFPKSDLNGSLENRLPNNINICFPKINAEFAVLQLDAKGFAISSSSSCNTLSANNRSYVIDALGNTSCSESSLRITLGRDTTRKEILNFIKTLRDLLRV
jgi:cysteine desulfurase